MMYQSKAVAPLHAEEQFRSRRRTDLRTDESRAPAVGECASSPISGVSARPDRAGDVEYAPGAVAIGARAPVSRAPPFPAITSFATAALGSVAVTSASPMSIAS